MLLCPTCHKHVDDEPETFTREVLLSYKSDHEERIRRLTAFGPDMQTTVVQLRAQISGRTVDIPITHVYDAVAPRWPTDQRGWVIDLTGIGSVETKAGAQAAQEQIDREVRRIYDAGMDVQRTRHVSLFALAPIPILAYLGARP